VGEFEMKADPKRKPEQSEYDRSKRARRHQEEAFDEARSDPAGPELLRSQKSSSRLTSAAPYGFGDVRAAAVALLTVTLLSGSRTCGVATTTFAGHVATSRSSLTVFADTAIPGSTRTRILSGKPPSAI
jgi:hypothetical protein